MMKNGIPIPVHADAPSIYIPIHEDDIIQMIPGLLKTAAVPAPTLNLSGQEHVRIEEWTAYMSELTGLEPKLEPTEQTIESVRTDNSKLRALVGEAKVGWKDGMRRMIETRHPDRLK